MRKIFKKKRTPAVSQSERTSDIAYQYLLSSIEQLKAERDWLSDILAEYCNDKFGNLCELNCRCSNSSRCYIVDKDFWIERAREAVSNVTATRC